jgi:cytochrome c
MANAAVQFAAHRPPANLQLGNYMKHVFFFFIFVMALMLSNHVFAITDLHKKHACIACHADDKKLLGPSYQDVAARFAKDWKAKDGTLVKPADAPAYLAKKIRKGGAGNWSVIPMPGNMSATDAEINAMVTAILSTKPQAK